MKQFKSIEEFVTHLIKNNIEISLVNIKLPEMVEQSTTIEESSTVDMPFAVNFSSFNVKLAFLSEANEVTIDKPSDENIIEVEAYENIPNACGSGFIKYNGSIIYANMCEYDNKVKITLPILYECGTLKDVEFEVKISDSNKIHLKKHE